MHQTLLARLSAATVPVRCMEDDAGGAASLTRASGKPLVRAREGSNFNMRRASAESGERCFSPYTTASIGHLGTLLRARSFPVCTVQKTITSPGRPRDAANHVNAIEGRASAHAAGSDVQVRAGQVPCGVDASRVVAGRPSRGMHMAGAQ